MVMKRNAKYLALMIVIAMSISLAGCGDKGGEKVANEASNDSGSSVDDSTSDTADGAASAYDTESGSVVEKETGGEECESAIEEAPGAVERDTAAMSESAKESEEMKAMDDVAADDIDVDTGGERGGEDSSDGPADGAGENPADYKSGTLTAGEWNDNDNWGFLLNLAKTKNIDIPSFGINPLQRIKVSVTNGSKPAQNVDVKLENDSGKVLFAARTDYSGTAYVFYNVSTSDDIPYQITISVDGSVIDTKLLKINDVPDESGQNKNNSQATNSQDSNSENKSNNSNSDSNNQTKGKTKERTSIDEVKFDIENKTTVKGADIMFLFDTTGSMCDELVYLQKEFTDIAERTGVDDVRFSIDFYRDHGDAYVTRFNDFTDKKNAQKQLNAESVDGGGDYEEAVDEALNEALSAKWRDEAVKLLFIILDAPPHSTEEANNNLKNVVEKGAEAGIRIIPIASSGVDKVTESIMRTLALMTGGTYTFLTDDSGVGGSHLEPTIGKYEVEKLNDLLVKLVNRYTGK